MKAPAARSFLWLFWTLAAIGLVTDQATKYGIFAWLYSDGTPRADEKVLGFDLVTRVEHPNLPPREPYSTREFKLFDGTFDVVASYSRENEKEKGLLPTLRTISGAQLPYVNRGALFGWGGGRSDGQDLNLMFALVSFLAAAGITYWSTRPGTRQDRLLSGALGLILAGTLGNLYDRLVFSGVRDFMHWYRWYDWPVFNIADCCLVCGAGLLLAHAFFTVERTVDEPNLAAETSAEAPAEQATSSAG